MNSTHESSVLLNLYTGFMLSLEENIHMIIKYVDEHGRKIDLPKQYKKIEVGLFTPCLEVSKDNGDDDNNLVQINGQDIPLSDDHITIFLVFDKDGKCDLAVKDEKGKYRYYFERSPKLSMPDAQRVNLSIFAHSLHDILNDGEITISRLFDSIQDGKINLLVSADKNTGIDDDPILKEIEYALPYAQGISSRPRMQLKTQYSLLDVELAKRINSHSLQHLAAHSEHWKARTVTGLIPKRIVSQISEDDTNIYENIFFAYVMKKALSIVGEKEAIANNQLMQSKALLDWDQYSTQFFDYNRANLLYKLLPEYDNEIERIKQDDMENYQAYLYRIESGLSTIFSSRFYRELDREKINKFSLPVHITNILRMDSRYHEILSLWNKILSRKPELISGINNLSMNEVNSIYLSYNLILLLYGLSFSEYEIKEEDKLHIKNGKVYANIHLQKGNINITISVAHIYKRQYIRISYSEKLTYSMKYKLSYPVKKIKEYYHTIMENDNNNSQIIFKKIPDTNSIKDYFRLDKDRLLSKKRKLSNQENANYDYWDKEWRKSLEDAKMNWKKPRSFNLGIYPIYSFLSGDVDSIKKITDDILKKWDTDNLPDRLDSIIFTLPYDTNNKDILAINDQYLVHRLINYGGNYLPEDSNNGGFHKGILPVSQEDIISIQRLIKTINLYRIRLMFSWGHIVNTCPVCGSHNIINTGNNSYRCGNPRCGIVYGNPRCHHCGRSYEWMQPSRDISVQDLKANNSPIEELLWKENLLGGLTITDFKIERDNNDTSKLKTIPRCPYCGHLQSD